MAKAEHAIVNIVRIKMAVKLKALYLHLLKKKKKADTSTIRPHNRWADKKKKM